MRESEERHVVASRRSDLSRYYLDKASSARTALEETELMERTIQYLDDASLELEWRNKVEAQRSAPLPLSPPPQPTQEPVQWREQFAAMPKELLIDAIATAMGAWDACKICDGANNDDHDSLPHAYEGRSDSEVVAAFLDALMVPVVSPPPTQIKVDGKTFQVATQLRWSQLLALVNADTGRTLWLSRGAKYWDDELVEPSSTVALTDGMEFYTLPPWSSMDLDMVHSKRYVSPPPTQERQEKK